MVGFKLCISDPSSGKTFQKEIKDAMARPFIGLNIGEAIKGDMIELGGYELQITGGSDYCGFPMRSGILGARKRITIQGGVGFRGEAKGIKRRKTVCGHKIHEKISQINLKITKQGTKKLAELFGVAEKEETKEHKPAEKEEKTEHKPEAKEHKPEHKEHAEHKADHEKPTEHKAEHKEEKKEHKAEHHEKPKEHKEEKKE